jgi:peptidyl-prolyl cis-trans isomerase SurA
MRKRSGLGFIEIFCIVVVFLCGSFGVGRGDIMLDRVVAIVNAEVITWSELYKAMEFDASPEVKALSAQERRNIFKQTEVAFLESLINIRLILQTAKTESIGASDSEVMQTIKDIKKKYNMTDEDFNKAILREGFTLAEYKKKLAEQVITSKLLDHEVRRKVVVTEQEISDYLRKNKNAADEGYHISLILIKNSGDVAVDENRVGAAYARLQSKASFADVAGQFSDDSSSRAGGDKGFVRKADLSREFVDALSKMKTGEVSEPFRTSAGTNIIKLEEARLFNTDADLKAAVRTKLFSTKFDRAYKAWIKGLRQNAYVEIK